MSESRYGWQRSLKVGALVLAVAIGFGWAGFWLGGESGEAERLVIPPNRSFFLTGVSPNRYLSFEGSWELEGPEKTGFKASAVRYICLEEEGRCSSADATVFQNSMGIGLAYRLDASWAPDRVTIEEKGGECRTGLTIVDLVTEDVTQIIRDRPDRGANCNSLPLLAEPRRARLISGFDRYFDEKYPGRRRN